jgi:6-phosphofructokinase (EC 2.7.1.11)
VPAHLREAYKEKTNDLTPDILKNLDYLGIDYLVPIGGDDTLSYGVHLHQQGVKVVAVPKTMDNDVPGTDYCIGFSTCVTRTIALSNALRTSAGSHERFLVIEVFGRYAGFTALLPTLAAAADRCLIPEHPFDMERLAELLSQDRAENASRYAIVIVAEGATPAGGDMVFCDHETDMFGHKKLGGIGDLVSQKLKELAPKYNNGRKVDVLNQKLGYLVRCGEPDALDYIIPMAFGNIAFDLIQEGKSGRMACLRKGEYDDVPLEVVTSRKKIVDIDTSYDRDRLRPLYSHFSRKPFLLIEGA